MKGLVSLSGLSREGIERLLHRAGPDISSTTSDDVADGPRSLLLEQVRNGVPTRIAVLAAVRERLG